MLGKENTIVRLLSDGELYREAEEFVRDFSDRPPRHAQVQGLAQFSQSWADWTAFVKHQKDRQTHPDHAFYLALSTWNQKLPARVKEWGLIPEGLSKNESRAHSDRVCGLLVAEFAQHLAAEIWFCPRRSREH